MSLIPSSLQIRGKTLLKEVARLEWPFVRRASNADEFDTAELAAPKRHFIRADAHPDEFDTAELAATPNRLSHSFQLFSKRHNNRIKSHSAPDAALELDEKPLRIVQLIAPSKIAGAERSTVSLCRGLSARGHRVSLLVKYSHNLLETARDEGVDASSMRFAGKLNLLAVSRLARWFRRNDVDIVATQLSTASLWGTLAARYIGVPSVATVRALNSKTCYVYADRIIAVSHAVKEHLVEQGVERGKIRVVYNGVDLQKFVPPADRNACKNALGLSVETLLIGVVAHLTAKKGHKWFLDSVAPLFAQFPDLRVVFLGEGEERANLQQQLHALGCENRVIFAGFHGDVIPWMAAMDALVLPPIAKEGFGRVLVEAGAMSIPVIGSDIGGINEVIVPGETGFLVAPGDENALRHAVKSLLDAADLREKMGACGRKRALSEFSQECMVANTERVYRELLAERA